MDIYPTKDMLEKTQMKIVDIRTAGEWKQTGIVPGSKTVTFFDEMGGYDAEAFLKAMDDLGGKDVEIGLICRTGARTSQIANFMEQAGYNVNNLAGGVMKLMSEGYELEAYES